MSVYYTSSSTPIKQDKKISPAESPKKEDGELPWRFTDPKLFQGYGRQNVHPNFWTTSSTYGSRPPNSFTMPEKYFSSNNEFSKTRVISGNYRNNSLNTSTK